MKNQKKETKIFKIIISILFIIGIINIIIGLIPCIIVSISKEDRVYVTGKIVSIEKYQSRNDESINYKVYVEYKVDNQYKRNELGYYENTLYEGQEIEIYYSKNDINNISSDKKDILIKSIFFLCFGLIGSIYIIIGIILIIIINKSKNKNKKLKNNGTEIIAEYKEVVINDKYYLSKEKPYNIICTWTNPKDNIEYTFKSENIWTDPTCKIIARNISYFKVYVNPKNLNLYYVDIDNILD